MLKIMIVDNEAAIRKGLAHCIHWEMLGCTVAAQAEDGIDALEQITVSQPDIVISDIRMPGMDGLELAKRLSERYPRIQTILLTGFPDFSYAQKAISYGVVDFVLKPTSMDALTSAIEKAKARIAQERTSEELERALADSSEQNLLLQRGIFLHDLVHRVDLSHLYVLNRMAQLGLNLSNYYVLRFDIVPTDTQECPMSYLADCKTIFSDCFSAYPIHFVPRGDHMGLAVVCTEETQAMVVQCQEVIHILSSLSRFSLLIGISTHYTDPLSMADAAEEANQAVQFAHYSVEYPVVPFSSVPAIPKQALEQIFSLLQPIRDAMQPQLNEAIKQMFICFRHYRVPFVEARNICLYVQPLCVSTRFLDGDTTASFPQLNRLLEADTLEKLESEMLDIVATLPEDTHKDINDIKGTVRMVKHYIAQHYAEDLSLETLASSIYLSPSYLSKIFKREAGENLSSYIQNLRIEQAKHLLLTTGLKAYEVAERIGIPDPVYFSRIFKKVTGYKPKDFRSSQKDQESP